MAETINKSETEEISLKDLIISFQDWVRYLWSKWWFILLFGILGAVLGFIYAALKKPVYTASTTFVLDAGDQGSGLSAYAGLASSFGIDLGGGGGGIFQGENILELYKSRTMISQALLSPAMFNGKQQLLIDRLIEFNKLREQWKQKPELKNIQFNVSDSYSHPRQQILHDSLLSGIAADINKNYLKVEKPDKKLNIIAVSVKTGDELFAKAFNEQLVQTVNNFYLQTKTKKSLENVAILQQKADSIRGVMSGAIYRAANIADATPNQNPTRMVQRVAPIQNAQASAEINKSILAELVKNLELSKISLQKETPLIQIVDKPILPLEKSGFGKLKGIIIGGIISGIIGLVILITRRIIREALEA